MVRTRRLIVDDGERCESALTNSTAFSSRMVLFGDRRIIPQGYDPPSSARFWRFLNPLFHPRRMESHREDALALTNNLIDRVAASRCCEFVSDFALPLPGGIFMKFMGLPTQDLDFLLEAKDHIMKPNGETLEEERRADQLHWARQE